MQRLGLDCVTIHSATGAVIQEVCVSLEPRQILGIVGPNGCGKTSMLRAVQGVLPASKSGRRPRLTWGDERRWMTGRIYIDGEDVTYRRPGDRGLGLVPQNLALFPGKTARDNILFPLVARGVSPQKADAELRALTEILNLGAILERRPDEISGGEQQRVAIARAIIARPRLVLFDEPLANLDGGTKRDLLLCLKPAILDSDGSAVYVTHDPGEAGLVCDVVAFIHGGRVQQCASPADSYNAPATLWIARAFSGFINAIPGRICGNRFFPTISGSAAAPSPPAADGLVLPGLFPDMERVTLAARKQAFVETDTNGFITGAVETTSLENGTCCSRVTTNSTAVTVQGHLGPVGSMVSLSLAQCGEEHIRIFDESGALVNGEVFIDEAAQHKRF